MIMIMIFIGISFIVIMIMKYSYSKCVVIQTVTQALSFFPMLSKNLARCSRQPRVNPPGSKSARLGGKVTRQKGKCEDITGASLPFGAWGSNTSQGAALRCHFKDFRTSDTPPFRVRPALAARYYMIMNKLMLCCMPMYVFYTCLTMNT